MTTLNYWIDCVEIYTPYYPLELCFRIMYQGSQGKWARLTPNQTEKYVRRKGDHYEILVKRHGVDLNSSSRFYFSYECFYLPPFVENEHNEAGHDDRIVYSSGSDVRWVRGESDG